MLAYLSTSQCRMQYLAFELDDSTATACGRCDNCAGTWFSTEVADQALHMIQSKGQGQGLSLPPRAMWPGGLSHLGVTENGQLLKGRIPESERAEEGRALARLTDLGWGNTLREIFRNAKETPEADAPINPELGRACVQVLSNWDWAERPGVVVGLPSPVRPQLLESLARGLAQTGKLAYLGQLNQVQKPGHFGGNSVYRCAATIHSYGVPEEMADYLQQHNPVVLLVTDLVDSRWSITAASRLLRNTGARAVLPFALASTN